MATTTLHTRAKRAWALARRQHDVISRAQLLDLGFSVAAIRHRIESGRLHELWRGVYAVGRPTVSRHGMWMAAILACGPTAALSHSSAAALWEIAADRRGVIELSVSNRHRRHDGIRAHRRTALRATDITHRHGVPVTTPVCTLIDLAAEAPRDRLERMVNEADIRGIVKWERLQAAADRTPPRPGTRSLRRLLAEATFALTDSELEQWLLRLLRGTGLPRPLTRQRLYGYRADFYWPDLGLVVEADSLRYHRTPAQQRKDRLRDQVHVAAGLTVLRFTHWQIRYDPAHVRKTLVAVAARLAA